MNTEAANRHKDQQERDVLHALRFGKAMMVKQLAAELGWTPDVASAVLRRMRESGVLVRREIRVSRSNHGWAHFVRGT